MPNKLQVGMDPNGPVTSAIYNAIIITIRFKIAIAITIPLRENRNRVINLGCEWTLTPVSPLQHIQY